MITSDKHQVSACMVPTMNERQSPNRKLSATSLCVSPLSTHRPSIVISLANEDIDISKKSEKEIYLREKLPVNYVLMHSIILIIFSVLVIIFQSVLLSKHYTYWFIGFDLFVSVYLISISVLAFLLTKYRLYWLFVTSIVSHTFGFLLVFTTSVVFNYTALYTFKCSEPHIKWQQPCSFIMVLAVLNFLSSILCAFYLFGIFCMTARCTKF